jgi:hypothetical protein
MGMVMVGWVLSGVYRKTHLPGWTGSVMCA